MDTHIHRLAERWGLSNGKSVEQTVGMRGEGLAWTRARLSCATTWAGVVGWGSGAGHCTLSVRLLCATDRVGAAAEAWGPWTSGPFAMTGAHASALAGLRSGPCTCGVVYGVMYGVV